MSSRRSRAASALGGDGSGLSASRNPPGGSGGGLGAAAPHQYYLPPAAAATAALPTHGVLAVDSTTSMSDARLFLHDGVSLLAAALPEALLPLQLQQVRPLADWLTRATGRTSACATASTVPTVPTGCSARPLTASPLTLLSLSLSFSSHAQTAEEEPPPLASHALFPEAERMLRRPGRLALEYRRLAAVRQALIAGAARHNKPD